MGKKAAKSSRKFAASGQLKKTIQARRKHQEIQKKIRSKKARKGGAEKHAQLDVPEESGDDDDGHEGSSTNYKPQSVNDFLAGAFMDNESSVNGSLEDEDEDDESGFSDNESFSSVDDLEDDGKAHLLELSQLAEKDPEFFKYLQENDRELLEFNADALDEINEDMSELENDSQEHVRHQGPSLTLEVLRKWQKALLQQHSLRALRKLLIAFRAAARMNDEEQELAWSIDSSTVYDKLVVTALRYVPIVLEHHIPYKTLSDGRYKLPAQSHKQRTLTKLVLSYFHNIIHVIGQLSEPKMIQLALSGSARLVPYILTSRKAIKLYLKMCLELWSTGEDDVRISAILSIRRMVSSTDESMLDKVLKGTYLTLIRSAKNTTTYTLPGINLMKNSAADIYCLDHAKAYQHAFGYIRQLAIHLRNSMKVKTKDAFKQVYNWQYVHSVDFWALVLGQACDIRSREAVGTGESELHSLVYPLVQVTLGAIKLIPAARSYPFHLHLVRSLLHLMHRTRTYIPLSQYLLPILTTSISPTYGRLKPSTLKPLDLETSVRAPQQYLKTRVYSETLAEEAAFLLAEWFSSRPVQGSIAFPEISVPVLVVLRKALKTARNAPKGRGGKEAAVIKALVDRVEDSTRWIEKKRSSATFGPAQLDEIFAWEKALNIEDSPIFKYLSVQRKTREKKRQLVEKARKGEDEMLED